MDYRTLNALTKPDVYPLPRIDDALDLIGRRRAPEGSTPDGLPVQGASAAGTNATSAPSFTWVSTIDLASGYWQVNMAKGSKERTAFSTRGEYSGLWQFRKMPFGLRNSPATFQRLVSTVLRSCLIDNAMVYLDDIMVYTKGDVSQHLRHLSFVMDRLRGAGLSAKLSKCRLFQTSVEYLGHVITREGVATDPTKVAAIRDLPHPTTITGVRALLGSARQR